VKDHCFGIRGQSVMNTSASYCRSTPL